MLGRAHDEDCEENGSCPRCKENYERILLAEYREVVEGQLDPSGPHRQHAKELLSSSQSYGRPVLAWAEAVSARDDH